MQNKRLSGAVRGSFAVALVPLVGLAASSEAVAQNNSLFGGARSVGAASRPPSTQPAKGMPRAAVDGSVREAQGSTYQQQLSPKPNSVLLRVSPYAVSLPEPETYEVNDLITIIIRESKSATTDSKVEQAKEWKIDTELKKWIKLSDKNGIIPALFEHGKPAIEFEHTDEYAGDGKYDRKDQLTTRMTATVIDVKPNGNLVLEARKHIRIDEEGYVITLVGTCRTIDVTPQNTVLSTQLAMPEISVEHTGAVRDATRRGWLKRALDFLRPF